MAKFVPFLACGCTQAGVEKLLTKKQESEKDWRVLKFNGTAEMSPFKH